MARILLNKEDAQAVFSQLSGKEGPISILKTWTHQKSAGCVFLMIVKKLLNYGWSKLGCAIAEQHLPVTLVFVGLGTI